MNTTTDWPRQLQLPGQAAAPPGPVELTMMYLMHHAFRRDLAAFSAAAAATPAADRDRWRRLARRWRLFATALHHHHSAEDAGLWPLLLSRVDAAGQQVLTAMQDEHAEIAPILESCAAGFTALAATADEDTRAALVVRVVAAKESLARHLAHEETAALTLVQQHLTVAEWKRLEAQHFAPSERPARTMLALLPWVMHQLPEAAQQRLVAAAPMARRAAWLLTRPGFEGRERRAFGRRTG